MTTKTIRVLPNPDHAKDHTGLGQAAVQYHDSSGQQWVGARLDHEASAKAKRSVFVFDRETPVELNVADPFAAAYYRRRLQAEELLPADPETRAWAGLEPPAAAKKPPKKTTAATE